MAEPLMEDRSMGGDQKLFFFWVITVNRDISSFYATGFRNTFLVYSLKICYTNKKKNHIPLNKTELVFYHNCYEVQLYL